MHTCIVCGGQTTEGSPICDACRGVSTASPLTTDEKQARLTAVLRAASMRAALEEAGGGTPLHRETDPRDDAPTDLDAVARDGRPADLGPVARDDAPTDLDAARDGPPAELDATRDGSPARHPAEARDDAPAEPGTDASDGSPVALEAGQGALRAPQLRDTVDAGDDETIILRVVDPDARALEAPPARRVGQTDVPSRLIAAFVGTHDDDAHPVIDIAPPGARAPASNVDADAPAADEKQPRPDGGAAEPVPDDGGAAEPVPDDGGAAEPPRAARPGRPADRSDTGARWITAAQAALIGVGLLCLVQLVVLLVLDGYLARAASTANEARAIAAQHKVAGVMLPALVGLALAATALAAWRVLLQRQDDDASSWWSMPAGLPLGLWAVLFMASVLLGVAMPGGQATVTAARRVDQVAMVACALLGGACVIAARQLIVAPSRAVEQRGEARLQP